MGRKGHGVKWLWPAVVSRFMKRLLPEPGNAVMVPRQRWRGEG